MYEGLTFDTILARLLNRVSNDIDKREGSIIYDALAPAAAELAQMYAELDINYNLSFADTATGEYLSRITAQFGVNRQPATKARRRGDFYGAANAPVTIPLGTRFAIDDLSYVAVQELEPGVYALECESVGAIGNQKYGTLLPIAYVSGLERADLSGVLVPGEDEEADDILRARYYGVINEPAFGGNEADYKQTISAINGVGAVKVTPTWDGGGTVKGTIIGADWNVPSEQLVEDVQTYIDPVVNSGAGSGMAPIGHKVTITGVNSVTINVEVDVILNGITLGQVQADIEAAITAYLLELRKEWANQSQLIVRVAQIGARLLTVHGVEDVTGTMINGSADNVTLTLDQIPEMGTVTINE